MKIIIDTNLWISFLIGKKLSIMKTLFTNTEIQIYICDELMTEFNFVASRPKIRKYITDEDIWETYLLMEKYCYFFPVQKKPFLLLEIKMICIFYLLQILFLPILLSQEIKICCLYNAIIKPKY